MNESAHYLGEVIEQLIFYVRDLQKELKALKRKWIFVSSDDVELTQGILNGHYIVIGKLFNAVASLGIFEVLPKALQQEITPAVLVEDLKQGELKRICLLYKAYRETWYDVEYGDVNLQALFEEIIAEGLVLKHNLQSVLDEGTLTGYSFCLLTLYNQVEFFVPKLFKALPKQLRKFVPESLGAAYKK